VIIFYSTYWNHKQPDEEVSKEQEPGQPKRKGDRFIVGKEEENPSGSGSRRRVPMLEEI
jgi:hypothetical protein